MNSDIKFKPPAGGMVRIENQNGLEIVDKMQEFKQHVEVCGREDGSVRAAVYVGYELVGTGEYVWDRNGRIIDRGASFYTLEQNIERLFKVYQRCVEFPSESPALLGIEKQPVSVFLLNADATLPNDKKHLILLR